MGQNSKTQMVKKKVQKIKLWKKTLKNQIVRKLENSNDDSSYGDCSDSSTNSDIF